jgi:ectoine hydroxylase
MKLSSESEKFWEDGYFIIRKAFKKDEMQIIKRVINSQLGMKLHAENIRRKIQQGQRPSFETIFVWNDTARFDIFSKAVRSHKIMERLEFFYQDEVYVYHNKVILKYPGIIGFLYHQDYAYWYGMGNLYPDMAAAFIAVDESTKQNGCLKIIKGSHKMGRIEHVYNNGVADSGVCPARLKVIRQRLPEVYIELDSGDAVIFHCNTLHGSNDNTSQDSRIALIGTYNTKHNDPYITDHPHPNYQPQAKIYERIVESDINKLPDFDLNFTEGTD